MRRSIAGAVALSLTACSNAAERQQRATMSHIEQKVNLPADAHQLNKYARYYATDGDRVLGMYITYVDPKNEYSNLPVGQQRWIKDSRNLPGINDGGCSVVNIWYNPSTKNVEKVFCNGFG